MNILTIVVLGLVLFIIGFLSCFYWLLFTPYSIDRLGPEGMDIPEQTPNKIFIERHKDRRLPDQVWGEQITRAFRVAPTTSPVSVKNTKPCIEKDLKKVQPNTKYKAWDDIDTYGPSA